MNRRTMLRLVPSLSAVLALEGLAQPSAPSPRITREQLKAALGLLGLTFKEQYLEMMLPNVDRTLGSLTTVRQMPITMGTPPAFRFDPVLPGHVLPAAGTRFAMSAGKTGGKFRSLEELAYRPVTQLASLLRTRRVTSTQLTKMYLERLKRYSPVLHCTVSFTEELALEQAKRADREIKQGRIRGPLHGIPYGAKDLFATKKYRTTWGAEPFQDQVLDYNATVIDRCEQAGAVLIAKLSMGALAMGGEWFGGVTRTPWNTEQTSSGSSAGSAAATAAGLVGFALGTETLGSIVTPSIRCAVTGLRPTFGRVSRHGAMALSWTMDKVGPICRSVEDCTIVLHAIAGADGKDLSVAHRVPVTWDAALPLAKLRVGVLQEDFAAEQAPTRRALYETALKKLRAAGANLRPAKIPEFPAEALLILLSAEAAEAFDEATRDDRVAKLSGQKPSNWPNLFRAARTIPAVEYIRANRARTLLMEAWERFFADWDVLVSPGGSNSLVATNLTGHPQIVTPCGFAENESCGLLFTGRLFEEGVMARVAMAYQNATAWHTMQPPAFEAS